MLKKIIEKAKSFGFDDAEIVETTSESSRISLFKGNVDKNFMGSSKKYLIKGLINGKMSALNFEKNDADLSDEEIDNILKTLKENVLSITTTDESSIFEGSEKYPEVKKVESHMNEVSIEKKIEMVKEMEKNAYAVSDKVELVHYCQYIEQKGSMKMVNTKGLDLFKEHEFCGLVLGCVCGESKENPNKQDGFGEDIVKDIYKLDPNKVYKKATDYALGMVGAIPVESKQYKVIIEKDCMTSILQGFFSIFTGEAIIMKVTPLADKLNTKIMSEKITISDDPLMEEALVQEPFDAEGVATYNKNVVENGVFKLFLHNLKTAKTLGAKSTGNAAKKGVTGMNFHINNGDQKLDDMISSLDEGLLITDIAGLHAGLNPISGDFSGQASGYYIKDGKKVHPVSLVVISGNFLKMMNDVVAIANDLEVQDSGFGAPSIQFGKLPISGK